MNKIVSYIMAALVGAVLVLILMRGCGPEPEVDVRYIKGDSIPYKVYENKPVPYKVVYRDTVTAYDTTILDGDTVYVQVPVDTALILRDYFATVIYADTVKNDSSALIVINETLTKNRIASRQVWFQNRRATRILEYRKRAIVVGGSLTTAGADVSVGARIDRNVFSAVYGRGQVGLRYQREFRWKK